MRNKSSTATTLLRSVILCCLVLLWGWCSLALFYNFPALGVWRTVAALIFAVSLPLFFLFLRPFRKGLGASVVCLVFFFLWWQSLQPTGDREWATDVARIAHGEIRGDSLLLHNVRNFRYHSLDEATETWQKDVRWETREYDLAALQGLDLFLSYWASEHIAHVIMSWDFGEDKHLAISIETRKDSKQEYSAVQGFFKQYMLSYVAADEKDVIRLRTNFRKERVYKYRLQVSKEKARDLLEAYVEEMNGLLKKPEFYNAFTRNCSTAIFVHTKAINPDDPPPMDWRILASGHLDELLYEKDLLQKSLPFPQLRRQSRIDLRMQALTEKDFSRLLRSVPIETQ